MPIETHVQIVQHLQPGGIETMALDLCRFSQQGKRTLIISLEGSKEDALLHWPRLKTVSNQLWFLGKPAGWSITTVWALTRLLRRIGAERVHTHHIGPMVYGGLAARLARVPQWIHTEHDAWHLQDSKHQQLAGTYFRLFKPLLVADAGLVARQIKKQLPGVLTDVVYNGIDTGRFCPGHQGHARAVLGLPQAGQLIGCAARLHPVKGQQRLIHVLTRFPHNVSLVLAGEGETRERLLKQAIDLGVEDRVIFLGNVDDMPAFYRAIDVFCLTSDAEGLPLSPLEAQACNTPAVVTDVGGARETVCPVTGSVVPLDDEYALIRGIASGFIVQSPTHPRQFIERQYDVRKMVKEYDSLAHIRWSA
jgi:glycosyltransferase involved in cell wall biosynthesis